MAGAIRSGPFRGASKLVGRSKVRTTETSKWYVRVKRIARDLAGWERRCSPPCLPVLGPFPQAARRSAAPIRSVTPPEYEITTKAEHKGPRVPCARRPCARRPCARRPCARRPCARRPCASRPCASRAEIRFSKQCNHRRRPQAPSARGFEVPNRSLRPPRPPEAHKAPCPSRPAGRPRGSQDRLRCRIRCGACRRE
jgi:hypothetical protein